MFVCVRVCVCKGDHKQKFYWGHKEVLLPVYKNMADAVKKHPEVDVLISFASLRSAYDSAMETMQYPQVRGHTHTHTITHSHTPTHSHTHALTHTHAHSQKLERARELG